MRWVAMTGRKGLQAGVEGPPRWLEQVPAGRPEQEQAGLQQPD